MLHYETYLGEQFTIANKHVGEQICWQTNRGEQTGANKQPIAMLQIDQFRNSMLICLLNVFLNRIFLVLVIQTKKHTRMVVIVYKYLQHRILKIRQNKI